MKKILVATVIIISMFLSQICFADSLYFRDVTGAESYAKAADSLTAAGIINGYADGSFGASRNITRAEMAAIICRFMGLESIASNYSGYTTDMTLDVPYDHWASGYVNLAVERGIISGDGNGLFRPGDNVKFEEAVKMLVCASGLETLVEHNANDWAEGYLKIAQMFNITDSATCKRGEYANRGNVALMAYASLACNQNCPSVSYDSGTYYGTIYVDLWNETDADIYYSLKINGTSTPWQQYNGSGIEISDTTVLSVVARRNGVNVCKVKGYIYEIENDGNYFEDNTDDNYEDDFDDSYNDNYEDDYDDSYNDDYDSGDDYDNSYNDDNYYDDSYEEDEFDAWDQYDHYDENGNFIKYRLDVTMSGCGGIYDMSGEYAPGSTLMLYISPGSERGFVRWTATAGKLYTPDKGSCLFEMPDEDVEVCAEFTPDGLPPVSGGNSSDGIDNGRSEDDYLDMDMDELLAIEDEVIELVNIERENHGLHKLEKDEELADVAREHSRDMYLRNFFDHNNPDGKSPFDRMREYGITYSSAGENIAKGQESAEAVVDAWMNSPGHRANILSEDYEYIGVGLCRVDGVCFWTQCFKSR